MKVKIENLISISEANQNFSKVAKLVDDSGEIIILKNNKPKYVLSQFNEGMPTENEKLELIARRILSKYKHAFEVLGK